MGDIQIEGAMAEDQQRIHEIFQSWEPDNWDAEYAKKYFDRFFQNPNSSRDKVFVGSVNGDLVGVIGYCPEHFDVTRGIYWLGWFYVHKEHVGSGYGDELLNHVIKELTEKNARKIFVYTSSYEFYHPAVSLYKKFGFREEGVLSDYYGKGEDQLIFGKSFRPSDESTRICSIKDDYKN